jgi:beta-galactosidase/beta-glucuronidase
MTLATESSLDSRLVRYPMLFICSRADGDPDSVAGIVERGVCSEDLTLTRTMAIFWMLVMGLGVAAAQVSSERVEISSGWTMQDVAHVTASGAEISSPSFKTDNWYKATVPGTVLTTLVNNGIYPEPLYGENSRPESIPESLVRTSYWYRTTMRVPLNYRGRHVWLNFDGINYSATVWVNGVEAGKIHGAFVRGMFDITAMVKPGTTAALAVLVDPQPNPGIPHEHTLRAGVGPNGGISAMDGATFLSTIGWDWLAAVRDRDIGIWKSVFLQASGPARLKDTLVTTDLPLPKTDSTDIAVTTTLENVTGETQTGVVRGRIDAITFEKKVELAPHSTQPVRFDAKTNPALHMLNPKLWWPAGYGAQPMYTLQLEFVQGASVSDTQKTSFGVRKIQYSVPESDNLTISVNGVRVFIRGGDWGLDEAMKRAPRERLETQIKLHRLANMNLIRNWVGQSTNEDFYDLCDKYGILVWDEFFQPNSGDGPDVADIPTYMANVRDKILRFRNHPSIILWCARNEGDPPPEIDAAIKALMAELEPERLYQPSSASGHGVASHGPYHWQTPQKFYNVDFPFKTEIGSVSVPTLESIHGMMPQKDWESINDDWAQHDFAKGNSGSDEYPAMITSRYGKIANLADFVRKSQLANYEAFRAMYEGRAAKMFTPATAVITWMSNPAQPSFVWQIYHYDLEPNSALYGVKKAGESVHVQWNELTNQVQIINNTPSDVQNAVVKATVYALDGKVIHEDTNTVTAKASVATSLVAVQPGAATQFVRLELHDAAGKLLSQNFYWRGPAANQDDLNALESMPSVELNAQIGRRDIAGHTTVTVTLKNPTQHIALMTHLQLRRASGERVLPSFASDNYLSLAPGESRTVTIEAETKMLHGEAALVAVDGWNVSVVRAKGLGASIEDNIEAQPGHLPVTGLPYQTVGLR